MQERDPHKPSLNPRHVLAQYGAGEIARQLRAAGYIIQARLLTDLKHALRSGKALNIEGRRGSGKTALAEAISEAFNLTTFYVQGMSGLTREDILGRFEHGEFEMGEALGAFDYASKNEDVPVLICDEVDKLTEEIEHMFLQLLGRGYAHIPRMKGRIGVTDSAKGPIVILTSNNRREMSEPMRSRCIFTVLKPPTPEEEVRILLARVPEVSAHILSQVMKINRQITEFMPHVVDKPGLREYIDLCRLLVIDQVEHLDATLIDEYLSLLGKKRKELESLRAGLARLEHAALSPHEEVDEWVSRAFTDTHSGQPPMRPCVEDVVCLAG